MRITEKPSKNDAHNDSHTDKLFKRKWACSFGTSMV